MCQAIGQDAGQVACLDVMISTHPARSYVQLCGELDLTTAPGLEQRLGRLCRDGHRQIIPGPVRGGFSQHRRADRVAARRPGPVRARWPARAHPTYRIVRRVFAITGLDATLTIQPVARDWVSLVDHVDLGSAG